MASKGQKWDWRQASLCPELSHPRTRLPTQPPASSPLSLHSLLTAPCCPGMGTAPPCQMSPPTTGWRTSSLSLPFRWFREAGTSLTAHTSGSPRTASERRTRADGSPAPPGGPRSALPGEHQILKEKTSPSVEERHSHGHSLSASPAANKNDSRKSWSRCLPKHGHSQPESKQDQPADPQGTAVPFLPSLQSPSPPSPCQDGGSGLLNQ